MSRVAAVQFKTTCDVQENLATCLRMIDEAAALKPALMVLPEFCNHLSWYNDQDHAWAVALDLAGTFLQAIAARAKQHDCYIVINVSLRRTEPDITVTSLLYSPEGECIAQSDKQTLMGHENDFFVRAKQQSEVVHSKIGRLGIFPCRDGVTCETPRSLALRGAQIFCDSLNSFALDEASLHVPVRAPENKVFLVAANKVGPLIPEDQLDMVSEFTHIPVPFLMGAGESQIVAPDGTVLAKAPKDVEAVIVADIDVSLADQKLRPDGSNLFSSRRPDLYHDIVQTPSASQLDGYVKTSAADLLQVVLIRADTGSEGEVALQQVIERIEALPSTTQLVVLPELFWRREATLQHVAEAEAFSRDVEQALVELGRRQDVQICTTLIDKTATGFQHVGVLLDISGRLLSQPQLHRVARYGWSEKGGELHTVTLAWGTVAILTGDDSIYPELAKVAALKGVHCLLVPFDCQESWEDNLGLLSRSAENRVCLLASSRATAAGTGLVCSLEREFTIMQPWQDRIFDGNINYPIITRQEDSVTLATIHPSAAANKVMSANTDLLLQRPWHLSADLIREDL